MDFKDLKKGTAVIIAGGRDVWTVCEDATDDDIQLKNAAGVVISCDYARLIKVPSKSEEICLMVYRMFDLIPNERQAKYFIEHVDAILKRPS